MILHIPHAHPIIPEQFKHSYLIDGYALDEQLRVLTDWYTHELFQFEKANVIDFPFSRFLVDVERFENDLHEPMAAKGMGRFYTKTIEGEPLRDLSDKDKQQLRYFYESHHGRLWASVVGRIKTTNKALIVDCHSFPDQNLPIHDVQPETRPDICIGYDDYHFDELLIEEIAEYFEKHGYTVGINTPYAGSIVPGPMYLKLPKVQSVMIELNRRIYMNEETLEKLPIFYTLKSQLYDLLKALHFGYPPSWRNLGENMTWADYTYENIQRGRNQPYNFRRRDW